MPAAIAVDNTLGAGLIAIVLGAVLYGVICLQVYYYYVENCERDRYFLRGLVAVLLVLETFQLILLSHTFYTYAVKDFGDYLGLSLAIWSYYLQVAVVTLIELLVQGFFAWRIYILSSRMNWLVPTAIMLCSLGVMATGLTFLIEGLRVRYFSKSQHLVPWVSSSLALSIASDVLITSGMMYYLSKSKEHTFASTKRGVHTLMIYSINTSLITTIFNVLTLATFLSYETTMIDSPFFSIMTRLYACTLLSTLNSRKTVRAQLSGVGNSGATHDAYVLSEMGSQGTGTAGHVPPFAGKFSGETTKVYVASTKEVKDM